MENKHILLLIFFFFFSLISISSADGRCHKASCGRIDPPFVSSTDNHPAAGLQVSTLYCNKQNQTIIQLPSSRSYTVNQIDYDSHIIYIHQDFCKRNEIIDLDITGSPFGFTDLELYTFYNSSTQNSSFVYPSVPFPCLSSRNHSVIAVRPELFSHRRMPSRCKVMKLIWVSARIRRDIRSELALMWNDPCSESCENEEIPTSTKYGLTFGLGVPAAICIIGMICYTVSRVTDYSETHHRSIDVFPISIIPQPPSKTGLDGPTIESYPITMLGESCRLPNDDSACAICLSDYKTKEFLRTIPECNHYFHVECIDEWLKLNVTCPVCKNTPESSTLVTSCSST